MANTNDENGTGTSERGYFARLFGSVASAAKSATVEGSIGIAGVLAAGFMAIGALAFVPVLISIACGVAYVAYNAVLSLAVNHFAPALIDTESLKRAVTDNDFATQKAFLAVAPVSAAVTAGLPLLAAIGLLLFAKRLNNGIKGLLTVILVVWSIVLVLLAIYDSALTFTNVSVPKALVGMAAFLYAALPALAVLPVGFGFAAARNMPDSKYTSVLHAAGHIVGVMLESVALIAALSGEAFFGIAMGLDPIFVVPASLIAALGFIWGRSRLADAKKRKDAFDVAVWAVLLSVFGGYAGVITALSVQHLSAVPVYDLDGKIVSYGAERLTLFSQDVKIAAQNSYQLVLAGYIAMVLVAEFLTDRVDGTAAEIAGWFRRLGKALRPKPSPQTAYNSEKPDHTSPEGKA